MVKDRSGCCFPAALHAAVNAGGGGMEGKPAQLSRMWVCFETVLGFQGFVTVEAECKAVLPSCSLQVLPSTFLITSICTGDSCLHLSQISLFTILLTAHLSLGSEPATVRENLRGTFADTGTAEMLRMQNRSLARVCDAFALTADVIDGLLPFRMLLHMSRVPLSSCSTGFCCEGKDKTHDPDEILQKKGFPESCCILQ